MRVTHHAPASELSVDAGPEGALTYAIVTPARNELENLPRLAASVLAQTLLPTAWVIVDDHSDDGGLELARDLASEHPLIDAVAWDGPDCGEIASGRREGRDLHAFRFGINRLSEPVDVVVKVDADTSFDPEYFEVLLARFAAEPELGIAGGACWEQDAGVWVRRRTTATHPRGASRAYRWACVDDLMSLEPRMGWDGLDEFKVGLHGFTTRQFADIGFRHHRLEGGRERGRLHARAVTGRASWYMGYRPSFLILRSLYRTVHEPASIAMIWGYGSEAVRRGPRCPDPELLRAVRDGQRLRVLLRDGFPAQT